MSQTDADMDRRLRAAFGRSWTPEPELSDTDRAFNEAVTEARRGSKSDRLARKVLDRG